MIYSRNSQFVYSNLEDGQIFSEEDTDFRFLDEIIRLTEENESVKTEDDNLRIIE
jgi:hypothetical protein